MAGSGADERLAIEGGVPAISSRTTRPPPADDAVRAMLEHVWASGDWSRYEGEFGDRLCCALRNLERVGFAFPCCSGTFAVELALRAVGVTAGDEVILAAYDFPGNFRAIEAIGAVPVLVDIEPRSWCLDVAALADQFGSIRGPRTRAVVVSHLHGGLADMLRLSDLAACNALAVVEDACQATGAIVQGKVAGAWGDAGVLSFGGSKLLSAGRGGAIVTDQAAVFQRAKVFCERGNHAFPLSELQAAVLLPQIEQLADRNCRRAQAAVRFRQSTGSELLTFGHDASDLGSPSYYKLGARCRSFGTGSSDRDLLVRVLAAEGVSVGPGFRGFLRRGTRRCRKAGSLAHASAAADNTLLFHHSLLLEPPEIIDQAAKAVCKVGRRWESIRGAWAADRAGPD